MISKADISPFLKKCEETNRINNRPIFITPAIAQIFERTLQNQMIDYLEQKNTITLSIWLPQNSF